MQNIQGKLNYKIIYFTEFSKKKGFGHLARSKRVFNYLKKKFLIKLFINKKISEINNIIKVNSNKIYIFDLKSYSKLKINEKENYNFLFDSKFVSKKKLISFNPLNLKKGKFNGPKWFPYPLNFFFKKKKYKIKKKVLLIIQGGSDYKNNLKKIIDLVISFNISNKLKIIVKAPKKNNLNKSLLKKNNIRLITYFKNHNIFFSKVLLAISACGNFAYELGFHGIKTIYICNEKNEKIRAKILDKKGFGKFYTLKKDKLIKKFIEQCINSKLKYDKKMINFFNHNGIKNIEKEINNLINK